MRRLTSVFRAMSLREKLILSSFLCIVLPGAVTISVFGYATKDVIKEDTIQNMEQKLELTDRYITEYFKTMVDTTNLIQFDVEINSILRKQSKIDSRGADKTHDADYWLDRKRVHEAIRNISLANENLYITILLPNGVSYTNYSQSDHRPELFLEEPWIEQLDDRSTSQAFWLGAMDNYIRSQREQSPYVLTIAQSLKRYSEKPYGYVIVSMNERSFRDILTNHPEIETSMLIDRDGTILSHQDQNLIGQPFPYPDVLKRQQDYFITERDEPYLFLKRPLLYSKMQLVSLTSYRQAVQDINDIYTRHILLQVVFFSLFLVVLFVLVRRFTQPLMKLGQIASDVHEGKLSSRSHITGQDEIGLLGQSFDDMLDQINVMIDRVKQEQAQKSEYEFKMLQAQIKPHFLFNILNSIRLRVRMGGDVRTAEVLNSLSALLRMTFRHDREFITVQEEIEIVRHYVELLNFRHQNPIQLEVDLSPDCEEAYVPRLFLQPIIENAFHHGLQQDKGTIAIHIDRTETEMAVKVEDDGKGIAPKRLIQLRERLEAVEENNETWKQEDPREGAPSDLSGIGLKNVYDRMKIMYGSAFHLELESEPDKGTTVTVHIPLYKGRL